MFAVNTFIGNYYNLSSNAMDGYFQLNKINMNVVKKCHLPTICGSIGVKLILVIAVLVSES